MCVQPCKKKRSLTLIEVIVALGLTAIVLGTLFTFYRQLFGTKAELQKSKEIVFQRVWLQERLSQLFSNALYKKEGSVFYTAHPSGSIGSALYLYFDNGVDPDPVYCNEVNGMIYLGDDKLLKLCIFPDRLETLMEDVCSVKFSFFDDDTKEWTTQWPHDKQDIPLMVKIFVTKEKETEFVFFLPGAYEKIDYSSSKKK